MSNELVKISFTGGFDHRAYVVLVEIAPEIFTKELGDRIRYECPYGPFHFLKPDGSSFSVSVPHNSKTKPADWYKILKAL